MGYYYWLNLPNHTHPWLRDDGSSTPLPWRDSQGSLGLASALYSPSSSALCWPFHCRKTPCTTRPPPHPCPPTNWTYGPASHTSSVATRQDESSDECETAWRKRVLRLVGTTVGGAGRTQNNCISHAAPESAANVALGRAALSRHGLVS